MATIWRASLDTRHFSFEAFAPTRGEAQLALEAGFVKHAAAYRLALDWWYEDKDGIELNQIELGEAYRDRQLLLEPLPPKEKLDISVRAAWSQYLSDGTKASLARYKALKEQLDAMK